MLACVVLISAGFFGPMVMPQRAGHPWLDARPGWMLSPFLAVFEVTRDRSWLGASALVGRIHWLMVLGLGAVAASMWIVVAGVRRDGGVQHRPE